MQFHHLYPPSMQKLARTHWTPLDVAKKAVEFLVPGDGSRVLDIGSGVGKFCLSAAWYRPNAHFYGIEQRKNLVEHAEVAKETLGLSNVSFIHGNFTDISLERFDHFYFYNSFYENIRGTPKIDFNISFSEALYDDYNHHFFKQLEKMPAGTRVVTRCSWEDRIPPSYQTVSHDFPDMLKFHIKR